MQAVLVGMLFGFLCWLIVRTCVQILNLKEHEEDSNRLEDVGILSEKERAAVTVSVYIKLSFICFFMLLSILLIYFYLQD